MAEANSAGVNAFDRQHHPADCPIHGHPGKLTAAELIIYGFWVLLPVQGLEHGRAYRVCDARVLPSLKLWADWHEMHPLTVLEGVLAIQGEILNE